MASFTPEQIEILRASPYVLDVSGNRLYFTVEFKERFWKEYQQGRMPGSILREMGLDVQMLGQSRVDSIAFHVRKQAESVEGIHPRRPCGRSKKTIQEAVNEVAAQNKSSQAADKVQAATITLLTHRVAFLEQQMELLKKTISAGSGRKSQ